MIIKEYKKSETSIRVILREDNYDNRLSKFINLFGIAQSDFPSLPESNAEIIHYGGDRIKRTFGIEFSVVLSMSIPADYVEIKTLELTL